MRSIVTPINLHISLMTAVMAALMATGCGSAKHAAAPQAALSGTVTDVSGAPIAGASVVAAGGLAQAVTDSAGHYALNIKAQEITGGALSVQADRFAPVSRQVGLSTTVQDFVMRPYDKVLPIVLPTGGAPSVTAAVTRGDGTVTLTIPADSMVTASGAPASGNAEVRLTYWNPATDMNNKPASLAARLGNNSNVVLALQTLGMVDVQVVQGTEILQVAPGKILGLDQTLPPKFQDAMAQRPNGVHDPFLFYLDPAAGVWVLDGNLTYDPNAGMLRGELPHLTTWNYDLFENWNPPGYCTTDDILNSRGACAKPGEGSDLGGCVVGRALQPDGSALANQSVRLWLFDSEHISAVDVVTDASGNYCTNVGIRLCVPWANDPKCQYTQNTLLYHVSAPASPTVTSLPNPIPPQCEAQSGAYSYAQYQTVQYFNDCALINDDSTDQVRNTTPLTDPASVSISACNYCSGTGPGYCSVAGASLGNSCGKLPDVTLTPGGGATAPKCAKLLQMGDPCSADTAACCPVGAVCSDYVCVPSLKQ